MVRLQERDWLRLEAATGRCRYALALCQVNANGSIDAFFWPSVPRPRYDRGNSLRWLPLEHVRVEPA